MRPKISVLIIDKNCSGKEYEVSTESVVGIGENKIDVISVETAENIEKTLNKYKGIDCIISIGDVDTSPLTNSSFEIRKKWVHFDEFDPEAVANAVVSTFALNIWRDRPHGNKLFSVFTCTFNTPKDVILRLYESLKRQTYKNWNWWVLDDSNSAGSVSSYLEKLHDSRIIIIKNVTNHGTIGFNKHVIASAADGDYLVEVDHDDELTHDCLELLNKAFEKYEDADFVFSHALEEMDGAPVWYNGDFGLGQGYLEDAVIEGIPYKDVPMTPNVTYLTIRHIVGLPNHVRCWKRDFYHRIGGHSIDLSVLDDMDILIRTFLNGKMCKVNKILYIQHEGSSSDNNGRGSTTQGNRFSEIVRTGAILKFKYDKKIHERLLELGEDDPIWNEEKGYSEMRIIKDELPCLNYIFEP